MPLHREWDKTQRERRWLQATQRKKKENVCYTNWLHAVDIRIKRSEKSSNVRDVVDNDDDGDSIDCNLEVL